MKNIIIFWGNAKSASIAVMSVILFGLPIAAYADAPTVLITGSSRGIGFEFARQYAQKGWTVVATCRTPATATSLQALAREHDNVTIERLDVTDHTRIDELAAQYKDTAIDVLINNAGINPGMEGQNFGSIDYALYDQIWAVNTVAPLKIAEAFIKNVAASDQKKIITISSGMGSFGVAKSLPGFLSPYRSSKAALNMTMLVVAKSVRSKGIVVAILDPGIVDTDQAKGIKAPKLPPEQSVGGMISVIDTITLDQSGSFLSWDGNTTPW